MEPLGNIPAFILALESEPRKCHQHVIMLEPIFTLILLLVFPYSGCFLLGWLVFLQEAICIMGGSLFFDRHAHGIPQGYPIIPLRAPCFVVGPG